MTALTSFNSLNYILYLVNRIYCIAHSLYMQEEIVHDGSMMQHIMFGLGITIVGWAVFPHNDWLNNRGS